MKVETRCMTKKDLEDVNRIQNLRYPFGNDIYLVPRPYERTVKDYEKLAMDEHTFPHVVEVKGKVVGYSTIHVLGGKVDAFGFYQLLDRSKTCQTCREATHPSHN